MVNKLVPVLQNSLKNHLSYGVKVDDYTPIGNALIYTVAPALEKRLPTQKEPHG